MIKIKTKKEKDSNSIIGGLIDLYLNESLEAVKSQFEI